jgi:uncharacterized protein (TIGR00251 family)
MSGDSSATLLVRVIPRSGRTAVDGRRGEALLVRLAAAPVDGAANDALIRFLADLFDLPRRDVTLVAGGKSRDKQIRINGLTGDQLARRLAALDRRGLKAPASNR